MVDEKRKILVTGANGFLGRAVISRLQDTGFSLRATDLGAISNNSAIEYMNADITRPEELSPVLEKVTTVIHVAGLAHQFSPDSNSTGKFRLVNEIGTANVASVASAKSVQHMILISSVSVYGPDAKAMRDENTPCIPVDPYALSKYNAELRAIEIAKKSGMALTILRLATLYGEGDPGNMNRLMRSLDRGRFVWIGDGSNRKSLLYKGDAARICQIVATGSNSVTGIKIYNISAPACSMHEIVDSLSQSLGKSPLPVRIPASTAVCLSGWLSLVPGGRLKQLPRTIKKWLDEDTFDTGLIERDYGFYTEVGLMEGIKREVSWYRQQSQVAG